MRSKNIPLSISIVTYKTDCTMLDAALASIEGSTIAAKTCVVDNSPSDGLRSVVKKYGFTYIHTGKNIGFGRGHNLAFKMCGRSQYHLILNPDITFQPSVLQELYEFLDMNPEVGWVMPNILYPDGSKQNLCKRLPTPWDLFVRRFFKNYGLSIHSKRQARFECNDLDLSIPRPIPYLSGCFAFVRTSLLNEVGGFDEQFFMYLEDTDLVRRVGELSLTVFYPHVSVHHVHGRGSYRNLRLLGYHLLSTFRYFSKWGWFIDPKRSRINRAVDLQDADIVTPVQLFALK